MTTSNLMSIPIDIPWKRMGVSEDMMDKKMNEYYPPKWRSSVAIFYFEPSEEEQTLEGRIISYLKISCTITGTHPRPDKYGASGADEATLYHFMEKAPWVSDRPETASSFSDLTAYYPCHGAILQVGVFPDEELDDLTKYPYILDFEPKKREMYVSGTENREVLSASSSSLGVSKNRTNTSSMEVRTDSGFSLQAGAGGIGGGMSFGSSTSIGSSVQNVNLRTADSSRERRETYSYTTNLTHIYHLLNSYHLGTNRAIFFIQPRPNIADVEARVFFKGLRKLEGIQEFFLIVDRPQDTKGLCVKASLETAHLGVQKARKGRLIYKAALYIGDNNSRTASALGILSGDDDWDQDLEQIKIRWNGMGTALRDKIWKKLAPEHHEGIILPSSSFDEAKESYESQHEDDYPIVEDDWNAVEGVLRYLGTAEGNSIQDIEVVYDEAMDYSGEIFMTGRTIEACLNDPLFTAEAPYLTFDDKIAIAPYLRRDGTGKMLVSDINQMKELVQKTIMDSVSSSRRLPYGKVKLEEASFFQRRFAEALKTIPDDHSYNIPLADIQSLPKEAILKLEDAFGTLTRKDALSIEPLQLRNMLGLSEVDTRKLRTSLIFDGPESLLIPVVVPDVKLMLVNRARRILELNQMAVSEQIDYESSPQPRDMVIGQDPVAGSFVKAGHSVTLTLSEGSVVVVPYVIGMAENRAIRLLKSLSLEATVTKEVSIHHLPGTVLSVSPAAGTHVARGSTVTLVTSEHLPIE